MADEKIKLIFEKCPRDKADDKQQQSGTVTLTWGNADVVAVN